MEVVKETNLPTILTKGKKGKSNLKDEQRQNIFELLLKESKNGKVKIGTITAVAALFSVTTKTVGRIWRRAKAHIADGSIVDVSSQMPKKVGRKRVEIDPSQFSEIPLRHRTNIRSLSQALNMATTTVYRRIKEGEIRPHSNAMKPHLTEENKRVRLQFCLSMLDQGNLNSDPMFYDMFNCIHIDEKWFYMSKTSEKYYLLREEEEPLRSCKSKRFITKVMFLAIVARPRFDSMGNEEFSGKIGIFPFTYKEPAKRNSKNRVAGTLETKAISSVTKDVVRSCLIEKVLPAIRAKWPRFGSNKIFIQQDNAKPHIDPNDVEFLQEASKDGFDIRLSFQPPNSPDMNILDLGFFRAIQSLQHQEGPNTIDELIEAVEKSFHNLSSQSLNHIFLTLQLCMIEVLKVRGVINYKLPHIAKAKLEREGTLPLQICCDRDLIDDVLVHLQQ